MSDELLTNLVKKLGRGPVTVGAAESLTGGLVSAALTRLPGSSVSFQGGIVAYSNQMKAELLGVPYEIIIEHGAVSEECAAAMAKGARRKLNVEAAVATTGIAGPDGGTPEKPVGLVWLAAVRGHEIKTLKKNFPGDRAEVTRASVDAALKLLYDILGD